MLEALLFDFDGVVVNSEPVHCDCFRSLMRSEYGIDFTEQEYYDRYLAYTDFEAFDMILRDHNLPVSDALIDELTEKKTQLVSRQFRESIPAMPGAVELMAAARSAGIAVAICSGALRDEILLAANTVGALPHVQLIVSANDVENGKPDPEGYRLTRRRLSEQLGRDIPATHCLVIEDAPAGIAAGKAAGMPVLAVTNSADPGLLRHADRIVQSLADITLDDLHAMTGSRQ